MPHAKLVEQDDRTVLGQIVESTGILSFMTAEARRMARVGGERVLIPLADEDLKVTFYLTALDSTPARVSQIMECVRQQVSL